MTRVADDRLYALWRLAATTGMRRGELLGLSWKATELDVGRLRVEQQLITHPGECEHCGEHHTYSFGAPKSVRGERTIALDADTVVALARHRDVQMLERNMAGPAYRDHDLVFADELGAPIRPERLSDHFIRHRKDANIPLGSIHVLRHTAATIMLTSGIPLHVVAARLGDDPKTLLGTYSHLLPRSDEEAADSMASALAGDLVDSPLTTASRTVRNPNGRGPSRGHGS